MKYRTWLLIFAGGLFVAAVAGLVEPERRLLGWLRGESFYIGRPSSRWAQQVCSTDPAEQAKAVADLREGKAAAVPVLLELLRKGRDAPVRTPTDDEARWRGADLLGGLPPAAAPPAVSGLVAALSDPDPHVRAVVITSLGRLAPTSAEAVPALVEALAGEERMPAIRALAHYRALAAPAVPALARLLKDRHEEVRRNAARTLGRIGPKAQSAVPALVAALGDRTPLVREYAAQALGQIGQAEKDEVAALRRALKDREPAVRLEAVRAVGLLGPEARAALPDVRALLQVEAHLEAVVDSALPALAAGGEWYSRERAVSKAARHALLRIAPPFQSRP